MSKDGDTLGSWSKLANHPEFEAIKREMDRLRTEISMLVLERDELQLHECKQPEEAYMLSIGALEYAAYESECAVLRLKRKVELVQARRNRQERIVQRLIEKELDQEFTEYQVNLDAQLHKMNEALERRSGTPLTEAQYREIKKRYRVIVRVLHPDLHPELGEDKQRLFRHAVQAFERCDLDALMAIEVMVAEPLAVPEDPNGFALLVVQRDCLEKVLRNTKDSIAKIKSEYPYTTKALLSDSRKKEARMAELRGRMEELSKIKAMYAERLTQLLGKDHE